ncbi:hypothetical protein OG689_43045 [Kitasatospora sp. NBC_00240]|uniref:hypothetical protein n=1 Tax=Kitasatospora sp. NBC_00240 TaxID=2903567 RepID=UPI002257B994|nr:hypothetical protein [Kitasatospora sp. NBC_00240]MCX5215922.1 hypothetical protein [Kitasatospora sp. NBC_00240]
MPVTISQLPAAGPQGGLLPAVRDSTWGAVPDSTWGAADDSTWGVLGGAGARGRRR